MDTDIKKLDIEQLNNLKRYVDLALSNWKANKYNKSEQEVNYNISYFTSYLQNINTELRKHYIIEKNNLQKELENASIPNPAKIRRLDKINSLLLTNFKQDNIKFKVSKRNSDRVTSFTRNRR